MILKIKGIGKEADNSKFLSLEDNSKIYISNSEYKKMYQKLSTGTKQYIELRLLSGKEVEEQ